MTTEVTVGEVKQETKTPQELEGTSKEQEKKFNEDSIYTRKPNNRLIITQSPRRRYNRLNLLIKQARKILRSDETLTITGVDRDISVACELVEFLKRQKIAKVARIATNMNISPNFARHGNALAWDKPTPTIVFHLERGEHATFVGDFQQKKVIEIFEKHDPTNTGKLDKQIIANLNLPAVFLSDEEQQAKANKFFESTTEFDLPRFIQYCSHLVHPLLKNSVFTEKLRILGIGSQETTEETQE